MNKKVTEWNFKIVETPSIEYCIMCDAAGWLGHKQVHTAGIAFAHNTVPIYPVKDIFSHLEEGSILADVFPVYGDLDEEGVEAYDSCTFMGCHFTAFDHVEDDENPVIMTIDIKQTETEGHSPDVLLNSHSLKWDKVKSEYEELKNKYLHRTPNGNFTCEAYYIVRLYDITEPATVEILIENGADIAADDYALFRIARERYPRLWVWLGERFPKVISDHMDEIYGYNKKKVMEDDFFKSFDNFIDTMIGEKDIAEIEETKPLVKKGVLDDFFGFKKGFFS